MVARILTPVELTPVEGLDEHAQGTLQEQKDTAKISASDAPALPTNVVVQHYRLRPNRCLICQLKFHSNQLCTYRSRKKYG